MSELNNDFLECPLCFEIFTRVVETPCCHRCYCEGCLKQWLNKSQPMTTTTAIITTTPNLTSPRTTSNKQHNQGSCPGCRGNLILEGCTPNIPFQRLIDELPKKCQYVDLGCTDKVTRGTFEAHIKTCIYGETNCTHPNNDCPKVLKKDLALHLNDCPYRLVPCTHCKELITFHDMEKHLKDDCKKVLVKCTNVSCGMDVIRDELNEHLETECLFQNVSCPFVKYGCQTTSLLRGEVDAHLKEVSLDHIKTCYSILKKNEEESNKYLQNIAQLQKEKEILKIGIDQLSVLKPRLQWNPLSRLDIPVLLPYMMQEKTKKITTGDGNFFAIKPKSGGLSSLFNSTDCPFALLISDKPVPGVFSHFTEVPFYYEVSVLKPGNVDEYGVSIGFIDDGYNFKQEKPLGLSPGSYGFNVLQQKIYGPKCDPPKSTFGVARSCGAFGCGWDHKRGVIFFVTDGACTGTAFQKITGPIYPAITVVSCGIEISVNFGTSPFSWDISRHWKPYVEMELIFEKCLTEKKCTYTVTGSEYIPQLMYQCKTCNLEGNMGMCEVCVSTCHIGHIVIPPRLTPFFCDCGELTKTKKRTLCKCVES